MIERTCWGGGGGTACESSTLVGVSRRPARWVALWVAAAAALVGAGQANAGTFVVTSLADSGPGSLRQAILDSNASPGADVIQFNIPSSTPTIDLLSQLPTVTDSVTIDGTTEPAVGRITLDGSLAPAGTAGLVISANNSTVKGLVSGGFNDGIEVGGSNVQIDGAIIGGNRADGVNILTGNLVSITNSFIGAAPDGSAMGNGGNGIALDGFQNLIRSNTIANNAGYAVRVRSGSGNTISTNSVFNNAGGGIFAPGTTPALSGVTIDATGAAITGTVGGSPGSTQVVEVFSSLGCPGPGLEQGQVFRASLSIPIDSTGTGGINAKLPLLPGDSAAGFTATNTEPESGTGPYSNCVSPPLDAPPKEVAPAPPVAPPPVAGPPTVAPVPPPVVAVTVDVSVHAGTVLVNGQPLVGPQQIPNGSIVDTTAGTVTLQTALPSGRIEQMDFAGSVFKVLQRPSGLTLLVLQGGDFSSCGKGTTKKGSRRTASATKSKTVRILWGNGHGNFQTKGRYATAAVRGTIYFVADRCDGTFTRVKRGTVTVYDIVLHTTIRIAAGESYLAKP